MAKKAAEKAPGRKLRTLEKVGVQKWEKGKIVEGVIVSLREGTSDLYEVKGHLVDIRTEAGLGTYSCPTILHNYLKQVAIGQWVRIVCEGKIKARRGKAWEFTVEVEDNDENEEE